MKRLTTLLFFSAFFLCTSVLFGQWTGDLQQLLKTDSVDEQRNLIEKLSSAQPPIGELLTELSKAPLNDEKESHELLSIECKDGVKRPYCLYVPAPEKRTTERPLFVYLHGGVTRSEIIKEPLKYAQRAPFLPLAKKLGWFHLVPFGQKGAAWWEQVGMANVLSQIAKLKAKYSIDDDRVYLGGFSDGGSAAFCFAMTKPSTFAAFVALNGHMGVGSLDGDLSTFVGNMKQTPIYAVTTDKDQLYPTTKMLPTIRLAQLADAQITYRTLSGTHTFDYSDKEIPRIANFLKRSIRNPFSGAVDWETATKDFGRCHWIQILALNPGEKKAHWHQEANLVLKSEQITIGFHEDGDFKGDGDKVKSLAKGDTVARQIGLKEGDIIVRGGQMKITNGDDLAKYKKSLKRGSPIALLVKRGEELIKLRGTIPPPEYYYLFKRIRPSARVRAHLLGNQLEIEASRAAKMRLFLCKELIEPGSEVEIIVNGKRVAKSVATVDYAYLLKDFLQRRDRKNVHYGYLDFETDKTHR
mgnify:CR=1 FL=1